MIFNIYSSSFQLGKILRKFGIFKINLIIFANKTQTASNLSWIFQKFAWNNPKKFRFFNQNWSRYPTWFIFYKFRITDFNLFWFLYVEYPCIILGGIFFKFRVFNNNLLRLIKRQCSRIFSKVIFENTGVNFCIFGLQNWKRRGFLPKICIVFENCVGKV